MPESTQARERAMKRIGSVLKDKWRLDSLLGVGGMAAVYAATHRNKNRVAVKMLHPQFGEMADIRTRFVREGYMANTVEHAGAVKVLDDDVAEDGIPFLVMELLEGETAEARRERKGKLDVAEALVITDKLLDVLGAAHAKGIVHRDIKPENIFLTREGALKVLDFGIARLFETSPDRKGTRAGSIMGTPSFMAPEQALAKWDQVDARTDIWAVGATLLTLLTGRLVHDGETGNVVLIKSATTPAASLATFDASLPASVVGLVDRALAFDRDKRWADARSMREALRAAYATVRGGPAKDARPGPPAALPLARPSQPGQPSPEPMPAAPPSMPRSPADAQADLAARSAERDARAAELSRVVPVVAAIQQHLGVARKKVAAVQERLVAAKNERASLEDQFRRHSDARSRGVGEARRAVREALVDFADRALADKATFGDAFSDAREEIKKRGAEAEARAREAALYASALGAHDVKAVRAGIGMVAAVGGLVVFLFLLPFIIRGVIMSGAPVTPAPTTLQPVPPPRAPH